MAYRILAMLNVIGFPPDHALLALINRDGIVTPRRLGTGLACRPAAFGRELITGGTVEPRHR